MKKLILLLFSVFCISFNATLFSAVTSLNIQPVGSSGQYLEATSKENPVLHISVNAAGSDTMTYLEVINQRDSWYIGSADEPGSIEPGSVKLWYMASDAAVFSAASAVYVTHLAESGSTMWLNTFSQAVADGSGLWVTADIKASPAFGTMEMQTQSLTFSGAPGINSTNEPAVPSVFIVTDVTPSENLEIQHTPGSMQAYVSTGQSNVVPFDLNFYNNSPLTSADININRVTFTVKTYPVPGTLLAPSTVLAEIKLIDKVQGTKYGELTYAFIPGIPVSFEMPLSLLNVPAGVTVQTSVQITLASAGAAPDTDFVISLAGATELNAFDYYTGKKVVVVASPADSTGFPMYSNFSKLQKACQSINISSLPVLPDPKFINKGSTNLELMKFYIENPGDAMTAAAEVYDVRLIVTDSAGSAIVPRDLFSKISLTDLSGNIKYRVKTTDTIENSGNSISFSMTNTVIIPAGTGITVVARADISVLSTVNNFRLKLLNAADITCRDKNSLSPVPVTASQILPYNSPLNILSSSFKAAHTAAMPANLYPGQASVKAMELVLSSPLSFGSGTLLVRGITLTAKDSSGANINFSTAATVLRLVSGPLTSEITAPASSSAYLAFPVPLTIPALPSTASISVYFGISDAPAASSLQITAGISSLDVFQDNEPGRNIFVSTDPGDLFPMSSGTGYFSIEKTVTAFTNYPNPFRKGGHTTLAYYLKESSTVSISIYDLTGSLIRIIIKDNIKAAGSHGDCAWDGTDDAGRSVIAGTYLAKITVKDSSGTKTQARKVTYVK